ncbi:MAG: signal recognition particle subunit SRP19/SEC65 family protein [Candidatus Thermoplasmatota archaeon]|nr:signal recognition particle subunit SRP19/SEC65 family protein [Candidatus Thermoplasmatota archaeon]
MVKAKDDMFIIWPQYFDSDLPRSKGRRMPLSLSVHGPSAEELFHAARRLSLSPVLENEKAYPSRWMGGRGRIKIAKKFDKTSSMRKIAEGLVRKR